MVSLVNAVRDIGRLREINMVLVRHGFGEVAQRLGFVKRGDKSAKITDDDRAKGEEEQRTVSLAERVRLVAIDLGPSFVKLGQIASTRPDLMPAEWIVELKKLQDEVPPLPFEEVRTQIESQLGAPLEDVYESFEQEPLAAASIAQVHRAVMRADGRHEDVVVKVQRPGISATVARDLDILHTLARLLERTIPESHIYQPSALVEQFDTAITAELDFKLEADNAKRFRENFSGHPHAVFPRVFKAASSKKVLTMEFLEGHKVYAALEDHGHKGPVIARAMMGILIKMIFEDGFFHADPHPGNLMVFGDVEKPHIGIIDLGMVGRLSPEMRNKTIDMMIAALRHDYDGLADALYAIGTPTKKIDMRAYRAEVARLADRYLNKPLNEIDFALLIADLVGGATEFGLEIPSDFMLVGKALMTVEGVGKEIDPDLDLYAEARPYFMDLLRKRYAPERLAADVWRGIERLSSATYDLPQQTREVMDDLRLGRLTLRVRDADNAHMVDRLGRRIFAGLVVLAFVGSGSWMLAHEHGAKPLGIGLLVFGVIAMLSHLALDVRRR